MEIPQAGQAPLGLFIHEDALNKLRALDQTLPYEVRYWYSEETFFSDLVIGRGELVSVRGASGLVLDLSRCERHAEAMLRRPVHITYGLPMREWLEAMQRDFPHPAFTLGGCVIDEGSPKESPAYVCASCDAAAKGWSPPKP